MARFFSWAADALEAIDKSAANISETGSRQSQSSHSDSPGSWQSRASSSHLAYADAAGRFSAEDLNRLGAAGRDVYAEEQAGWQSQPEEETTRWRRETSETRAGSGGGKRRSTGGTETSGRSRPAVTVVKKGKLVSEVGGGGRGVDEGSERIRQTGIPVAPSLASTSVKKAAKSVIAVGVVPAQVQTDAVIKGRSNGSGAAHQVHQHHQQQQRLSSEAGDGRRGPQKERLQLHQQPQQQQPQKPQTPMVAIDSASTSMEINNSNITIVKAVKDGTRGAIAPCAAGAPPPATVVAATPGVAPTTGMPAAPATALPTSLRTASPSTEGRSDDETRATNSPAVERVGKEEEKQTEVLREGAPVLAGGREVCRVGEEHGEQREGWREGREAVEGVAARENTAEGVKEVLDGGMGAGKEGRGMQLGEQDVLAGGGTGREQQRTELAGEEVTAAAGEDLRYDARESESDLSSGVSGGGRLEEEGGRIGPGAHRGVAHHACDGKVGGGVEESKEAGEMGREVDVASVLSVDEEGGGERRGGRGKQEERGLVDANAHVQGGTEGGGASSRGTEGSLYDDVKVSSGVALPFPAMNAADEAVSNNGSSSGDVVNGGSNIVSGGEEPKGGGHQEGGGATDVRGSTRSLPPATDATDAGSGIRTRATEADTSHSSDSLPEDARPFGDLSNGRHSHASVQRTAQHTLPYGSPGSDVSAHTAMSASAGTPMTGSQVTTADSGASGVDRQPAKALGSLTSASLATSAALVGGGSGVATEGVRATRQQMEGHAWSSRERQEGFEVVMREASEAEAKVSVLLSEIERMRRAMSAAAREAQRQLHGLRAELAEAEAATESERKAGMQAEEEASQRMDLCREQLESTTAALQGVRQKREERERERERLHGVQQGLEEQRRLLAAQLAAEVQREAEEGEEGEEERREVDGPGEAQIRESERGGGKVEADGSATKEGEERGGDEVRHLSPRGDSIGLADEAGGDEHSAIKNDGGVGLKAPVDAAGEGEKRSQDGGRIESDMRSDGADNWKNGKKEGAAASREGREEGEESARGISVEEEMEQLKVRITAMKLAIARVPTADQREKDLHRRLRALKETLYMKQQHVETLASEVADLQAQELQLQEQRAAAEEAAAALAAGAVGVSAGEGSGRKGINSDGSSLRGAVKGASGDEYVVNVGSLVGGSSASGSAIQLGFGGRRAEQRAVVRGGSSSSSYGHSHSHSHSHSQGHRHGAASKGLIGAAASARLAGMHLHTIQGEQGRSGSSDKLSSDDPSAKHRPPHWYHSLSSSLSLISSIIRSVNIAALRFSSLLLQHSTLRFYLAAYVIALHLMVLAVIVAGLVA